MKIQFRVDEGDKSGGLNGPAVCTFPLGMPNNLNNNSNGIKFRMLANGSKSKTAQKQRLLHGYSETVHYVGKNYGEEASKKNIYNYAIGVSSGKDKSMTLVPVSHVYRMEQHVVDMEADSFQLNTGEQTFEEKMTQRTLLVEEFGSKKRKRVVRSAIANRVNIDSHEEMKTAASSIGSHLDVVSAKATVMKKEHDIHSHASQYLPPYDKDATNPEDIYSLSDMILDSEWQALNFKELIKISKKPSQLTKLATSNEYPSFVVQRLGVLRDLPKAGQKIVAGALVYLTYLIRFHHLSGNKGTKMDQLQCESFISDRILSTFGEFRNDKWYFSVNNRHKLLSYICVLALIGSNFSISQLEMELLTKDLKTKITNLQTYFKEVGGKLMGRGADRKVVLKAPLKLPVVKVRGARG